MKNGMWWSRRVKCDKRCGHNKMATNCCRFRSKNFGTWKRKHEDNVCVFETAATARPVATAGPHASTAAPNTAAPFVTAATAAAPDTASAAARATLLPCLPRDPNCRACRNCTPLTQLKPLQLLLLQLLLLPMLLSQNCKLQLLPVPQLLTIPQLPATSCTVSASTAAPPRLLPLPLLLLSRLKDGLQPHMWLNHVSGWLCWYFRWRHRGPYLGKTSNVDKYKLVPALASRQCKDWNTDRIECGHILQVFG